MRRVATELDTGAASLYVYIRNREDLVDAMVGRAFGEVPTVAPDRARWREQLFGMLDHYRAVLAYYPGMANVLVGVPTAGRDEGPDENAMDGIENMLALLEVGGVGPQDAAWACDILMLIVTATAIEADIRRTAGFREPTDFETVVGRLHTLFSGLPPSRYPQIVAHADQLITGDGDDRFRFAIDTFLDGLVTRAARG